MNEIKDIKYVGKDFNSLKQELVNFTKNYFPDTYNDFSPASPGMMFLEMVAYVGDILSFYQDTQLQETFLQYAKDPKSLYNMAYTFGYRPKNTTVAQTAVNVVQFVEPQLGDPLTPDWSQAITIYPNTQLRSTLPNSPIFNIPTTVDFTFSSSFDPTFVNVEEVDELGNPILYSLVKETNAFSGEIVTITKVFEEPEKFTTIEIEDSNIIGVLDIIDSNDDTWYEVPYLGQETVFIEQRNSSEDQDRVYNTLSLIKTPKRFITRLTPEGSILIQFGAGIYSSDDEEIIPSVKNVGLGTSTGIQRLNYTYDPSNFIYTRSYGLAPSNTTLTIRYLKGGGTASNINSDTLTQIQSIQVDKPQFLNNITFNNIRAASGGSDGDTVEEIRQNILRSFNEQGRIVTLQDYEVRAYSMPPTLGSISKIYATQEQSSSNMQLLPGLGKISLYILSYDIEGNFADPTPTLRKNLENYLSAYKMITDIVDIKSPAVVNIGVEYEVTTYPNTVVRDILQRCNNTVAEYFRKDKMQINKPINLSEIYLLLDKIKGVQTVRNIKIVNKVEGNYSVFTYDIQGATKDNIVYPSLDPCIFEVKFPDIDIKGRVTR
jgi:hypothetical protein